MSYLLIFWDGQRIQVSDQIAERLKILRREGVESFELGSGSYAMKGINKIVHKQEAYNIFPGDYESLREMEDTNSADEQLKLSGGNYAIK